MKVNTKESKKSEKPTMILRLNTSLLNRLDQKARGAGTSRQNLVESILKKVLADPDFEVDVEKKTRGRKL